jgi:hypothetical protein
MDGRSWVVVPSVREFERPSNPAHGIDQSNPIKSIDQSTNQPTNQPTDQLANNPIISNAPAARGGGTARRSPAATARRRRTARATPPPTPPHLLLVLPSILVLVVVLLPLTMPWWLLLLLASACDMDVCIYTLMMQHPNRRRPLLLRPFLLLSLFLWLALPALPRPCVDCDWDRSIGRGQLSSPSQTHSHRRNQITSR